MCGPGLGFKPQAWPGLSRPGLLKMSGQALSPHRGLRLAWLGLSPGLLQYIYFGCSPHIYLLLTMYYSVPTHHSITLSWLWALRALKPAVFQQWVWICKLMYAYLQDLGLKRSEMRMQPKGCHSTIHFNSCSGWKSCQKTEKTKKNYNIYSIKSPGPEGLAWAFKISSQALSHGLRRALAWLGLGFSGPGLAWLRASGQACTSLVVHGVLDHAASLMYSKSRFLSWSVPLSIVTLYWWNCSHNIYFYFKLFILPGPVQSITTWFCLGCMIMGTKYFHYKYAFFHCKTSSCDMSLISGIAIVQDSQWVFWQTRSDKFSDGFVMVHRQDHLYWMPLRIWLQISRHVWHQNMSDPEKDSVSPR